MGKWMSPRSLHCNNPSSLPMPWTVHLRRVNVHADAISLAYSQNESSQSIGQYLKTFTKFPELPAEIQIQIWQHAVPDPRSVHGVVRFLLDFDLGKPRAIIPSVREYKESYQVMYHYKDNSEDRFAGLGHKVEYNITRPESTAIATSRAPVFALLRTCQMARLATLERYRLAIGSEIKEENKPWWSPEEDMVILTGSCAERYFLVHWLFRDREEPLPVFKSLQHLAIEAIPRLIRQLLPDPPTDRHWNMEDGLTLNFPALQSFTLLVDPDNILNRESGRVLLHESEHERVHAFGGQYTEEFTSGITTGISQYVHDEEDVPLVELFVVGWKGSRSCLQ